MVTAYTPAPRGTSMHELYKYAGVVLEIDTLNDTIVDAELTLITDLAKRFFKRLLIGYDLKKGSEELSKIIRNKYWAPSDEAFIACLNVAIRRYFDTKSNLVEKN
ncbi:MAG: DUF3870 domain-containing protein [Deferribacterota bacterium]|nr:DUF3870 domain-containing protein [Deferribacterota bacterium]